MSPPGTLLKKATYPLSRVRILVRTILSPPCGFDQVPAGVGPPPADSTKQHRAKRSSGDLTNKTIWNNQAKRELSNNPTDFHYGQLSVCALVSVLCVVGLSIRLAFSVVGLSHTLVQGGYLS